MRKKFEKKLLTEVFFIKTVNKSCEQELGTDANLICDRVYEQRLLIKILRKFWAKVVKNLVNKICEPKF